jgi:hypothetical protein
MFKRIAVIKTGWCDAYDGDEVTGAHANVTRFKEGHERYNFRRGPDRRLYGYTPPMGDMEVPPAPKKKEGWLVFVVAKMPGRAGLYLVGWYEAAKFHTQYLPRPEYDSKPATLEHDVQGQPFSYVLTALKGRMVPAAARQFSVRGDRMKRSPVYYLRGNGEKDPWRETLARTLLDARADLIAAPRVKTPASVEPGSGICGDAKRRKQVEDAAVKCVKRHFGNGYHFTDRQKDKCGFDLLFVHKKTGVEHHVEVKGTAMPNPHFFISSNELGHAKKYPQWQLAMVTHALGKPQLDLMDFKAAKKKFRFKITAWHATPRNN